jgi:hypothetical protein
MEMRTARGCDDMSAMTESQERELPPLPTAAEFELLVGNLVAATLSEERAHEEGANDREKDAIADDFIRAKDRILRAYARAALASPDPAQGSDKPLREALRKTHHALIKALADMSPERYFAEFAPVLDEARAALSTPPAEPQEAVDARREKAIQALIAKWFTRTPGQHAGYLTAPEVVDLVIAAMSQPPEGSKP